MNRSRTKFCNKFAKNAGTNGTYPWTSGTYANPGIYKLPTIAKDNFSADLFLWDQPYK